VGAYVRARRPRAAVDAGDTRLGRNEDPAHQRMATDIQ
jgi:hypothetical protein